MAQSAEYINMTQVKPRSGRVCEVQSAEHEQRPRNDRDRRARV